MVYAKQINLARDKFKRVRVVNLKDASSIENDFVKGRTGYLTDPFPDPEINMFLKEKPIAGVALDPTTDIVNGKLNLCPDDEIEFIDEKEGK